MPTFLGGVINPDTGVADVVIFIFFAFFPWEDLFPAKSLNVILVGAHTISAFLASSIIINDSDLLNLHSLPFPSLSSPPFIVFAVANVRVIPSI